jgi:hypothetical protein
MLALPFLAVLMSGTKPQCLTGPRTKSLLRLKIESFFVTRANDFNGRMSETYYPI